MSPWVLELSFWISLPFTVVITSLLWPLEVQAQQNVSSNSGDYDFGWIAVGVRDPGGLPTCERCVNLFDYNFTATASVGVYPCCQVFFNEVWVYENSTNSFVISYPVFNVTTVLCLDVLSVPAVTIESLTSEIDYSVVVSQCNSSVVSQQWTWEGNRVRNGLTDSGGNLYLWSQDYDASLGSELIIASSQPHDESGSSYTADFTFLSTKDFVNRSTDLLNSEGLLLVSSSPTGQITNGDFETSTYQPAGDLADIDSPNFFASCGWVVGANRIQYVNKGILPPANGSYSIHLNSDSGVPSSISQTFKTDPGTNYTLSFYFTGFPPDATLLYGNFTQYKCGANYTEAFLQLQVTGLPEIPPFTTSVAGLTVQNLTASWTQKTVAFTASTTVSTVNFSSLNFNSSCGPMIDTVTVSPSLPVWRSKSNVLLEVTGSIGGLAGLMTICGIIYAIRYCTPAREDYSGLYTTEHARIFSMKELTVATKNFGSVLGEGGFGTVYKADFPDGTVGAVKVEKPKGPDSSSKVLASDEVAVLLRVHHRNLVNLMGFCIHQGRHLLLFEYLPNGSLYDRLHRSILPPPRSTSMRASMDSIELQRLRPNVIPWKQRVRIAADVACGLEYLHHEADPPVVHRDIKSQNILLTTSDSAKLADFGLSKTAPVNATSFEPIETMVKGSIGYLDPQYLVTGVLSPKSDVYSFGVVLLELISGHPAIYCAASLSSWAAPYMNSPSLYSELVDKKLDGEFDAEDLESLVDLSRLCMHADGKMRPNMRQVVALLNSRLVATIGDSSGHNHSSSSNSSHEA